MRRKAATTNFQLSHVRCHFLHRTDLGCCAGKADKHQDFFRGLGSDSKVGRCWWKLDLLNYAAIGLADKTDKPTLEGTFEVTCEVSMHLLGLAAFYFGIKMWLHMP
jgi:hypothetical protein